MDNRTSSNKPLTSGQKYVGRAPRACDSCRKMKVKCHLNGAGPCRNCQAASRPCTFDALGVKREKPPPKREVQKLKSKLSKFERFLESVAPGIDLTNLPETTEDAKYIVENFKSFNSASKKKDNLQSVGFCKPEKNELIGLWPSPSRLFHGSFGQPLVEKHMQELHTRYNDLSSYQPPNDLAQNLLDLYFRKINVFEHILHEGEFLGNYYTDLAKRNTSFRALTFAVYAAAARFCPDPRVCPIDEEGKPNREAAGALYLSASAFLLPPPIIPCNLFDLQTMALICYTITTCCSPMTAWFSTTLYMKRAQAVGAHRENSQRWSVSMMKDQLRKKAMWYLISREMQLCMCLGRGSSINQKYVDIEFPLCVDDETLTRLCEANASPNSKNSLQLDQSDVGPCSNSIGYVSMKAFFSVKKKFGCGLQKVLGKTNKPESKAWDWDVGKVSTLARDLDNYIKTQIPINVKWKPENQSAEDLIINARLNGGALSLQISIHRLLIQTNPTEILTCLSASSALLDILEYVRCRGLLEETSSWSTYMATLPTLSFLYAACGTHECVSPADRANAWANVHRCINILSALSSSTFLAGKLRNSLDNLVQACIREELFPDSASHSKNFKKREVNVLYDYSNKPDPKVFQMAETSSIYDPHSENLKVLDPQNPNFFTVPESILDASLFEFPGVEVYSCSKISRGIYLLTNPGVDSSINDSSALPPASYKGPC